MTVTQNLTKRLLGHPLFPKSIYANIRRSREQSKFICFAEAQQYMWTRSVQISQKPRAKQILFALLKRLSSKDWTHPNPLHPLLGGFRTYPVRSLRDLLRILGRPRRNSIWATVYVDAKRTNSKANIKSRREFFGAFGSSLRRGG